MKQLWKVSVLFLLTAMLFAVVSLFPVKAIADQDPTKPDIHLSFQIEEDGSNTTSIEVAVSPLIDPLIQRALQYAARSLANKNDSTSRSSTYQLTTTVRGGRDYHALLIHYNSLGDLNAFVNTPQMLSGFFGSLLPESSIPQLFSRFSVTSKKEDGGTTYHFVAFMEPETSRSLAFANVTIHVRLPGEIISHNALLDESGDLIWIMEKGNPLDISVVSRKSSHLGGMLTTQDERKMVLWVIGIILLALALFGAVLLLRRKGGDWDDEDEEELW